METASKKPAFVIIFISAIFIAVPAFAALDVSLVDNGDGTVSINYSGADATEPNKMPRAFALDITIDSPGEITDVSGYKNDWVHDNNGPDETGESNSLYPGFGIYPARISWWLPPGADSCDVNSWGTPLADEVNDPGAGEGLGSNHIVLEFASLYYGDVNAPLSAGTLCVLHINSNGGMNLLVHMTDEDTYRGGLVFEDGSKGDIDANIIVGYHPPPDPPSNPSPADGTAGVTLNTDLSWTAGECCATHRDVYFDTVNPPVVKVLSDTTGLTYDPGLMVQGKTYYWRVNEKDDCGGITPGPIWSFNTDCLIGGNAGPGEYAKWVEYGKPDCWCCRKQCRGDADCKNTALKPVMGPDLTVFKGCYNKTKAVMKTIVINGVPAICADFDHRDTVLKPVMSPDLTIFNNYYNDPDATVPQCDAAPIITGPVNFWTN